MYMEDLVSAPLLMQGENAYGGRRKAGVDVNQILSRLGQRQQTASRPSPRLW